MKNISKLFLIVMVMGFASCTKLLDRPPLTSENDETAWTSEEKLRLYANKYYTDFFTGYGTGFTAAPLLTNRNNDNVVSQGQQGNFTRAVSSDAVWSYTLIRSLNIMLDRIESEMTTVLTPSAKNHWIGVGKFYRAFRYSELVTAYGAVPYYDREILNTELDELYKQRTPRNEVMDAVYEDWKFSMEHVRASDGDQSLNKYMVAGFVSSLALEEGTWQKYYYEDNTRAEKFLTLAEEAAALVMNSGKYTIATDYKTLFTSKDLSGNEEMILYRKYDAATGVTHATASNSNLDESLIFGPSTDLIKSYLVNDGNVYQNSTITNARDFTLSNLIETRDPRFEATFYSKPNALNKGAFYYITKYFPRDIEKLVKVDGKALPAEFKGSNNETDAPVLRYAEVLLNWIEAKGELNSIGKGSVSQTEIDKSINVLRSRPLATEAVSRGVKKTAPLLIGAIPNDPRKDPNVSSLLWEIRRERRMELAFENNRLSDLKRWSKLEYMDSDVNKDLLSGGWVNFSAELPAELKITTAVIDLNNNKTIYSGSNASAMKGFYMNTTNKPRLPFLNLPNVNPYLAPIGTNIINDYVRKGYELKQTEGWPQN